MLTYNELSDAVEKLLKEGGGGSSLMSEIVDANGNYRFVEGDGTPLTLEGFTSLYCKWSLSGTHLMCVLVGKVDANSNIMGKTLATFTVPNYIGNKIIPVWSNHIQIITFYVKTSDGSGGTNDIWVDYNSNNITFKQLGNITSSEKDRYFRIQFDLLIDSE